MLTFLRAYSNRVTSFWRRYIDLVTHVYVFTLGSRNYGIWNYVGVDICLVFSKWVFWVFLFVVVVV